MRKRAKRDLSQSQFDEQLGKLGFKVWVKDCWYKDTTGVSNVTFGAILYAKSLKIDRRATMFRLIKDRERESSKSVKS